MTNTIHDDYLISTDKSLLDITMIYGYLSGESYWAKNMPMTVLKSSIDNSICFGVYQQEQQVGFARVITDQATFAYLADVFILETHRGKGLSKWLMKTIMSHADLQGLRRWMLGIRDAHSLYEQFGWKPLSNPERFMQIHNPDIYS